MSAAGATGATTAIMLTAPIVLDAGRWYSLVDDTMYTGPVLANGAPVLDDGGTEVRPEQLDPGQRERLEHIRGALLLLSPRPACARGECEPSPPPLFIQLSPQEWGLYGPRAAEAAQALNQAAERALRGANRAQAEALMAPSLARWSEAGAGKRQPRWLFEQMLATAGLR